MVTKDHYRDHVGNHHGYDFSFIGHGFRVQACLLGEMGQDGLCCFPGANAKTP